MTNPLPIERQDYCPYCGTKRTEDQGNNSYPRCPKQGCVGQHTKRPGKPVA
jgi:hypothetical protein